MTILSRLRWLRRSPRLAVAGVLLAAAFIPIASSVPAGADGEQTPLKLTPGVPVTLKAPSPSVPGYAATRRPQGEQTPDNCRSIASSYCDLYPLVMNVPPSEITAHHWEVLATLDYNPGTTAKNIVTFGDASTTTYAVRIYYDPPCGNEGAPDCPKDSAGTDLGDDGQGDDYAAASITGTSPPFSIGAVDADLTRKMAVTVAFYFAQPTDYTLSVELVQVDNPPLPPDLSGDEAIAVGGGRSTTLAPPAAPTPPAKTPITPAAPAAVAAPTAAPPASPSGPSFANGDLSGLNGVNGTSLGNDQLASLFAGKARAPLAPPGDPSTLALLLALLLLPLLTLLFPMGWMWRRRRNAGL